MVLMTILALCASLSTFTIALPLIVFDSLPGNAQMTDIASTTVTQDLLPTSSIVFFIPPLVPTALPSTSPSIYTEVITKTIETPIIEITQIEETYVTTTQLVTTDATVTNVVTVYLPSPSEPPSPPPAAWSAPAHMTDLLAFNTSATGLPRNLELVDEIPASASPTTYVVDAAPTTTPVENNSSILQVFYPANSINPGNKDRPYGGTQFYAEPLDITQAQNVTMTFRVFFPVDFDFVRGGKLPGLYGGHTGCSGGNAAWDCFSTRLMWRKDGEGELYLYAPKDKQTTSLCRDPGSVCDTAYGFSIGRGSFNYPRGAWTTLTQTVVLNTPGKQNGVFTLDVNDERIISRDDVYFRDQMSKVADPVKPSQPKNQGILGGLLGGILRRFNGGQWSVALDVAPSFSVAEEEDVQEVGFLGIFFSTFFGGHEDQWASSKDQYAWFKDFGLASNG